MVPGAAPGKITGGGVLPAKLPKSVSLPAEITNTILNKGAAYRQEAGKKDKSPSPVKTQTSKKSTEDYVSEAMAGGGDLNKFLEDAEDEPSKEASPETDSEDEAGGNPLVCGFQDDLDPEDLVPAKLASQSQAVAQSTTASAKATGDAVSSALKTPPVPRVGSKERELGRDDEDGEAVKAQEALETCSVGMKGSKTDLDSAVGATEITEDHASQASSVKDDFPAELRLEREEPDGEFSLGMFEPYI